jgi:integrase
MVSLKISMASRARSSFPQFRVRVPTKLVDRLRGKHVLLDLSRSDGTPFIAIPRIGQDIAFSLRTNDARVAAARQNDALEHLRRLFEMTESPPISISHKDMVALSGTIYHLYGQIYEEHPGESLAWRCHKALHRAVIEGRIDKSPPADLSPEAEIAIATSLFGHDLTAGVDALPAGRYDALEARFGLLADWVLIRHRLNLTPEDRRHFLKFAGKASLDGALRVRRYAEQDYSPDTNADRFPPIDTVKAIRPALTIAELVDGWWLEAKKTGRKERTRQIYAATFERLIEFLDHDDARRVTEADLLEYKADRLKTVSGKTFLDGDLPGLKSVFRWAYENRKISSNPAVDVSIKRTRPTSTRSKGFSDAEASSIFRACLKYIRAPKELPETFAAKRWSPLIAAYTGARIAEILQLRREDVLEESGHTVFRITPEAGSVKSGQFRIVPIHPHLIELGLLAFVEASSDGPLFPAGAYKRVVTFIRQVVPDPRVQPNHGWRHRYKSVARDLSLDPRVIDAIQGHQPRSASDGYGDVSVRAMAQAIRRMPIVEVQSS